MGALASTSQSLGLRLPPAFRLLTLGAGSDAFAHACAIAGESGAGSFLWVERSDVLEFAVVLEPEEPLVSARRAVFAGMAAIADALASFAPPEKPVTFSWPTTVLFDGGRLGLARLGSPPGCAEDEIPEWLVFSTVLLAISDLKQDPGAFPDVTWLQEEGFEPAEHKLLVESFARHLMVAFDTWGERGFNAVADTYLARLPKEAADGRRGIDENGDLLLHRDTGIERLPLVPALDEASWLDRWTGMPRP
jgi:biotin-(acetyl-CoA carboxylase) ligase